MTPLRFRRIVPAGLLFVLLFASCAAPISYKLVPCKTPTGDFVVSPLAEALSELQAGKSSTDPTLAAGHFVACARLAADQALLGEPGGLALYNHSVARLIDTLQGANALPWGRTITVGSGSTAYTLRGQQEPGAPGGEREFRTLDRINFHGKFSKTNATRSGVGAPVVAILKTHQDPRSHRVLPSHFINLTAVLRPNGPRAATLELHDPLDVERISIAGRQPVLAANFSAAACSILRNTRTPRVSSASRNTIRSASRYSSSMASRTRPPRGLRCTSACSRIRKSGKTISSGPSATPAATPTPTQPHCSARSWTASTASSPATRTSSSSATAWAA